jgi:hypothetical protein
VYALTRAGYNFWNIAQIINRSPNIFYGFWSESWKIAQGAIFTSNFAQIKITIQCTIVKGFKLKYQKKTHRQMGTHQFSKIHSKSHKNFRGSVDDLRNVSKIIASPSQGIHIPKTVWIINLFSDRGIFLLKGRLRKFYVWNNRPYPSNYTPLYNKIFPYEYVSLWNGFVRGNIKWCRRIPAHNRWWPTQGNPCMVGTHSISFHN